MHDRPLLPRFCAWSWFVVRGKSGVAAIEFAFIAPLLVLLFVCITDLGFGVYANMQVSNAAHYGAQYALMNGYDAYAITSAVKSSSDLRAIGVSPMTFCGCPGGDGVLPQPNCNAICTDGSPAGTFVRVSVTHTYTTLLPYPGLPSNFRMAAQSTMRLQ